jgi:hypothetical protein
MDKIKRLRRTARFYYLRKDIQKCIAEFSKNREVVAIYFNIFGKRPDIVEYPGDVRGLALNGVTSLHCSEELWKNPLELRTELTSEELDNLREGWDLILDIDCKFIEYSKIAAKLVTEALFFHNMRNFGVKFSGGSGFHIGISWKAFPKKLNNIIVKNFFPDGPRIIASYLREMIVNPLKDRILELSSLREISERLNTNMEDLLEETEKERKLNPFKIVDIDTILISSRHLFRMPYSLHERTGLSSIVIKPEQISLFHPGWAKPDRVYAKPFLPKPEKDEARELLVQAIDWQARAKEKERRIKQIEVQRKRIQDIKSGGRKKGKVKYEKIDVSSINEEMFPPCIKNILSGIKQDGRKRALFVIINFFRTLGINYEEIEKKLSIWNKKNYKPLRKNYVEAQLSWFKRQEEKQGPRMPPNCKLGNYYKEIGVCEPIALCSKIKNPVNFTIRKLRFSENKKTRKK